METARPTPERPDPRAALATERRGFRGCLVDLIDDPFYRPEADCVRHWPDGLLVVARGRVEAVGPYATLRQRYGTGLDDRAIADYSGLLLLPGFIDLHVHFPQTEKIAAYGERLLEWLERYIFPTERKFSDRDYARQAADFFIDELLRQGTTSALVFATVHAESVEAFFEAAQARNLRAIAGKVLMDRNAPDDLQDDPERAYRESKASIEKWHGRDRLSYAISPRFAITSTPEQLEVAGRLLREYPDVYLHTHLSETAAEVAWVRELFPDRAGYLDVYDRAGLVGPRSIFAHGVQLTDGEFARLSQARAAIAFCPTSNLFLGSGLFPLEKAKSRETPVQVGLGTDVGAGTSFSLLQTAAEAYKVAQLRQGNLSPFQALFLATLGGARSLHLDDKIGNFEPGKEADFVAIDPRATPLLAFRNPEPPQDRAALADWLFSLLVLGDDRAVRATYLLGNLAAGEPPA